MTTATTPDRGDGRLYREKGSRFWWMAYYVNGKEVRQSSKETDEKKARKVLKRHVAAALHGEVIPHEGRVTLGDLLAMVETDYAVHKRRSAASLPYPLRHLRDSLGAETKAVAITSDVLDRYILARQEAGAATATIRI